MSDIDQVVRLLEQWRDAGALGRVKVGVEAARAIGALPAARKRELALEVAGRVAPQLLPAIQAESGDLTSEQVGAVVDLIRRADREQLDGLVTALRTGEMGVALDMVDDAVDIIAPPLHPAVELPANELQELQELEAAAAELVPDDVEVDVAEVRAEMQAEAAEATERWRDASADRPDRAPYVLPSMSFTMSGDELPPAGVPAPSPGAASHDEEPTPQTAAPRWVAEPATPSQEAWSRDAVEAVRRAPDGYRRRRAAVAAIRDEHLRSGELLAVLALLERPMDRTWVAGAALDAGLLDPSAIAELPLPATARARLERRAELR